MVGVVILPSVRPVCQLFFFGINPLCGVAVHMHTHATLAILHHSLNHIYFVFFSVTNSPGPLGILCFKAQTCIFPPLLCCFSLYTLADDACRGKMSSRSDVNAINITWHKLCSSIAAIDSTDASAHTAEDEMCLIMPFKRF